MERPPYRMYRLEKARSMDRSRDLYFGWARLGVILPCEGGWGAVPKEHKALTSDPADLEAMEDVWRNERD